MSLNRHPASARFWSRTTSRIQRVCQNCVAVDSVPASARVLPAAVRSVLQEENRPAGGSRNRLHHAGANGAGCGGGQRPVVQDRVLESAAVGRQIARRFCNGNRKRRQVEACDLISSYAWLSSAGSSPARRPEPPEDKRHARRASTPNPWAAPSFTIQFSQLSTTAIRMKISETEGSPCATRAWRRMKNGRDES